jgi:hypothetical protein
VSLLHAEAVRPVGDEPGNDPVAGAGAGPTRVLRAALVAAVVFGAEWNLADPTTVASHPDLWPLPWTLLILMVPVGIGVWAFEVTADGEPGFKNDFLRGVLGGTLVYVGLSFAMRLAG